jgi:lipopolysaccharide heptosyltransferase I
MKETCSLRFNRILIVRSSAVGDVVLALPTLDAIRSSFPQARIGYIVDERPYDLIASHPFVDRVHFFPRKRWAATIFRPWRWPATLREIFALIREMRSERYDIVLDLQANLKGAFLSILSGARIRVGFARGYCREGNYWFSHLQVTPPRWPLHLVEKFLAVAEFLGARPDCLRFPFPESSESQKRVETFLQDCGLTTFAVLHPGSSEARKDKRWIPEYFAEVARRLAVEKGLRCVVCYGPGERRLAERIVAASDGKALLSLPTENLLDLIELFRRACIFIGTDSGPMHIAAAVGIPCVALFGSGSPTLYGPYPYPGSHHRLIYKPRRGFSGGMQAITVEEVYEAVVEHLARLSKNPTSQA